MRLAPPPEPDPAFYTKMKPYLRPLDAATLEREFEHFGRESGTPAITPGLRNEFVAIFQKPEAAAAQGPAPAPGGEQ